MTFHLLTILGPNHAWSVSGATAEVYQGHLAQGGGSGQTSLPYLITPFNSLTNRAVEDGTALWWIMNNSKTNPFIRMMIQADNFF